MKKTAREKTQDRYAGFIEALVLPFAGHKDGKDCRGEFFDERTNFMADELPYPPVIYAHGYPLDKGGEAVRTVVGQTMARWMDDEGGWARLGIYSGTPLTDEIMKAHASGTLGFSSTALLKELDDDGTGHVKVWLPGEFSVITGETPVQPCNLLSRAAYSKAAFEEIIDAQPEELRPALRGILGLGEDGLTPIPITDNNAPINPEADIQSDGQIEFPDGSSSNTGELDMTPEELRAMMEEMLSPITSRIDGMDASMKQKCGCEGEGGDEGSRAKTEGAGLDFLRQKTAALAATGETQTVATEMIDTYIKTGRLDPALRLQAIGSLSTAIEADGRRKTDGGAVDNFLALLDANPLRQKTGSPAKDLKGFGFKASTGDEPVQSDVDMMVKAAKED